MHEDELCHYGVKGMKWGVRKEYEPHPRKKKARNNTDDQKSHSGLKRAAKIGAGIAAAGLAAYGGYRLIKSGKAGKLILKGRQALKVSRKTTKNAVDRTASKTTKNIKNVTKHTRKIDPNTGFALQTRKLSPIENAKRVNQAYSTKFNDTTMNCGNCSIAMELRMRGYDVKAKGLSTGQMPGQIGQFFNGLKSDSIHTMDLDVNRLKLPDLYERMFDDKLAQESGKKVEAALQKSIFEHYKDDYARGALSFSHAGGGHYIYWIKENGNVKFYDAQNPEADLTELFGLYNYVPNKDMTRAIRLDDLDINANEIKNIVQNYKEKHIVSDFNTFIDKGKDFVKYTDDSKESWLNMSTKEAIDRAIAKEKAMYDKTEYQQYIKNIERQNKKKWKSIR